MILRPCLACGAPVAGTRCPPCEAARLAGIDRQRGTAHERGYDSRWARLAARARKRQPWCLDCGTTTDLTADHLRWPARTLDDIDVVCMDCNNKRGPSRGPRGNTRRTGAPRPAPQAGSRLLSAPSGDAR